MSVTACLLLHATSVTACCFLRFAFYPWTRYLAATAMLVSLCMHAHAQRVLYSSQFVCLFVLSVTTLRSTQLAYKLKFGANK